MTGSRFLLASASFLTAGIFSCASTPETDRWVDQMVITQLKVRRPVGAPADPKAGPGGVDYQSEPPPNSRLDCEDLSQSIEAIRWAALQQCLSSQSLQVMNNTKEEKIESTALYRLDRKAQPELVLDEDSKISCLKQTLPRIPIPREIFFQAEEAEYSCFNARVDIEAGELLGIRLPKAKYAVKLTFPIENLPQSPEETQRWLSGVVLTPFFDPEHPGKIQSKVVPTAICRRCFGDKKLIRDTYNASIEEPPATFWPAAMN